MAFNFFFFFWYSLTLPELEKLKTATFVTPINAHILNVNKKRTTSARSINLDNIKNLIEYSLRKARKSQCVFSLFLKTCCSKVGKYYVPHSESQGPKGLKFVWKIKTMSRFYWNCLKSDCLIILGGIEWFLVFTILFNPFSPVKIEKYDFCDSNNSMRERLYGICYRFIYFLTASSQFGSFHNSFWFSSANLLSKKKPLFFNFSTSPNVTNLFIDYGGNYVLVYIFKDFC